MEEKVYTFSSTHQASLYLLPQYLKRVMGYYKMMTLLKVLNGHDLFQTFRKLFIFKMIFEKELKYIE